MQSKLFGYSIDRSLGGAVYEASDSATGEPRLVLEWTPPADEREAARHRLEAAAAEVEAEMFSADASLYLVVRDREQASAALRVLQAKQLFPGSWLQTAGPAVSSIPGPPSLAEEPPPLAAPFLPRANGVAKPQQVAISSAPPSPPPAAPYRAVAPRRKMGAGTGCALAFLLLLLFVVVWIAADLRWALISSGLTILLVIIVRSRR